MPGASLSSAYNLAPPQRSYGEGALSVRQRAGATKISNLRQQGCAKIRVPSARANALEAVMINSSGGLTGGDRLNWRFDLAEGAALAVTTQACERVYAASADIARTQIDLHVRKGARLAWLPQETILFHKGAYARTLTARLEPGAEMLLVEPVIFGRAAMGEEVREGVLQDRWRIFAGDALIHAEQTRFEGDIRKLTRENAVLNGAQAMATVLLIAPRAEGLLQQALNVIGSSGGASYFNGKLLARLAAPNGYALRRTLAPLIRLLNEGAPSPKIWTL